MRFKKIKAQPLFAPAKYASAKFIRLKFCFTQNLTAIVFKL